MGGWYNLLEFEMIVSSGPEDLSFGFEQTGYYYYKTELRIIHSVTTGSLIQDQKLREFEFAGKGLSAVDAVRDAVQKLLDGHFYNQRLFCPYAGSYPDVHWTKLPWKCEFNNETLEEVFREIFRDHEMIADKLQLRA